VQIRDKDILKILFFIITCTLGYLTTWTLMNLDYANDGFSLLAKATLDNGSQFTVCKIKWWDYFIEIGK
jgi:hypothetical protein